MHQTDRRPLAESRDRADTIERLAAVAPPPAPVGPQRSPQVEAGWADIIRTYGHLGGGR